MHDQAAVERARIPPGCAWCRRGPRGRAPPPAGRVRAPGPAGSGRPAPGRGGARGCGRSRARSRRCPPRAGRRPARLSSRKASSSRSEASWGCMPTTARTWGKACASSTARRLDGQVDTDGDHARDAGVACARSQGLREVALQQVQVGVGVDEVHPASHYFFVSMRGKRAVALAHRLPGGEEPPRARGGKVLLVDGVLESQALPDALARPGHERQHQQRGEPHRLHRVVEDGVQAPRAGGVLGEVPGGGLVHVAVYRSQVSTRRPAGLR